MLQATTLMRWGEEQNCVLGHNRDSCLLPIKGQGVHTRREGSTRAIGVLERVLKLDPSNLRARWLLNIAHMTLGSYPDGVAPRFLIPPSAFAAAHPLPAFENVAGAVGLDIYGVSGGAVLEDLDEDGRLDVMVTAIGFGDQMRVFRNVGRPLRRRDGRVGADRPHRRAQHGHRRLRQRRPARRAGAARRLDGRGRPVPDVAAAQSRRAALRRRDQGRRPAAPAAVADRDVARFRRRRVPRSVRRQRVRRAGDQPVRALSQQPRRHLHRDRQGVRRRPGRLRQGRRQRRLRQRRRSRHLRVGGAGRQPAAPQRRAGAARVDRLALHQRRRPGRGGAAEEQLPGDVLRLRQRRLARSLRRAATGAAPRTSRPTTSASRPASSAASCTATRATARSPT